MVQAAAWLGLSKPNPILIGSPVQIRELCIKSEDMLCNFCRVRLFLVTLTTTNTFH